MISQDMLVRVDCVLAAVAFIQRKLLACLLLLSFVLPAACTDRREEELAGR